MDVYEKIKPQVEAIRIICHNDPIVATALEWYSTEEYKDFNIRMRQGMKITLEQKEYLEAILFAFQQMPALKHPIEAFRGVKQKYDFTESTKQVTSLSLDEDKAASFAGPYCCMLYYTIPAGSKIIPIKEFSASPEEEEILLPIGSKSVKIGSPGMFQTKEVYYLSHIPPHSEVVSDMIELKRKKSEKEWFEEMLTVYTPSERLQLDLDEMMTKIKSLFKSAPQSVFEKLKQKISNEKSEVGLDRSSQIVELALDLLSFMTPEEAVQDVVNDYEKKGVKISKEEIKKAIYILENQ